MVFQRHHLVDAVLVAAALKLSVQEGVHNLAGKACAHHTAAQAERVGVVVAAGELCAEGITAAAGADALHLVGAHRHTHAGAAAQDYQCAAAVLHVEMKQRQQPISLMEMRLTAQHLQLSTTSL